MEAGLSEDKRNEENPSSDMTGSCGEIVTGCGVGNEDNVGACGKDGMRVGLMLDEDVS